MASVSSQRIAERAVSSTEDVGINPLGIAFSNSSNRTLVGNTGDNSVTVLP